MKRQRGSRAKRSWQPSASYRSLAAIRRAALANGWPIATGIIEGACRHIIADRLGITGARWRLAGAQAMLWMRAIAASNDLPAYWDWHITREHQRNGVRPWPPADSEALCPGRARAGPV